MKIRTKDQDKLETLISALVYYRQQRDEIAQTCSNLEEQIAQIMEERQQKSISTLTDMGKYQTTYVRRTTVEVDEEGLRKALGAAVYDKFTVRKLDRKKLEQALEEGAVDPNQVSPFVSEKIGKAYLRTTEKREDEPAAD